MKKCFRWMNDMIGAGNLYVHNDKIPRSILTQERISTCVSKLWLAIQPVILRKCKSVQQFRLIIT